MPVLLCCSLIEIMFDTAQSSSPDPVRSSRQSCPYGQQDTSVQVSLVPCACLAPQSGYVGVKATVENPRGSVEKLSPKESVEGAEGLPEENPEGALTLTRSTVSAPEALS